MTPTVLVIGDVINDVIVLPSAQLERGTDTPAHITYAAGGSGANQAAWLARAGVTTLLAARVGRADLESVTAELRAHGVEPILTADDEVPTGTIVTLLDPQDGERSFLTDRGASARFGAADLPFSLLDRVAMIHISGYTFKEAGSREAIVAFAAEAIRRGLPVSYDPNSTSLLRAIGTMEFLAWTRGASMLFPNSAEATALTGTYDPARQNDILAKHYPMTVVKRGAGGADFVSGTTRLHADAPRIEALDTTGAGDAFAATFIAAHLAGEQPSQCLERAVAAGTHAASMFGGRPR
jgi:sugar/nucleoside kinase (ribokinase family)